MYCATRQNYHIDAFRIRGKTHWSNPGGIPATLAVGCLAQSLLPEFFGCALNYRSMGKIRAIDLKRYLIWQKMVSDFVTLTE